MQRNTPSWAVATAAGLKDKIDPKPAYQRGEVWKEPRKQRLLDSMLRGYDVPKLYLVRKPPGGKYGHEVADGQQRLRAVWDFYDGKYPLDQESSVRPFPDHGDLSGKYLSDLPAAARATLDTYQLQLVEIHDATEYEVRDLFLRLQEGIPLNPAEKRNAMMGNMRDFIADIAGAPHPVLKRTALPQERYAWDDLVAHVVRLELAKGPTDLKATNLKTMYENEQSFKPEGSSAKKVKATLNYLARVLADKTPEMDIKWGFVDLYLLVSRLSETYVLKDREQDIHDFYVDFESSAATKPARRKVGRNWESLLAPGHSAWDKDMYDYILAFSREGAKKANIQARHDVYLRRALDFMPDLLPKDAKRAFSRDERLVIYRRDGGVCTICKKAVAFEETHADHKVPFAKGGLTTVENGQTLCVSDNLKKSAKT